MIDPNISRYIWTHTRAQQLWILGVVAVSMIPYFMSFNLPKQIVNGPIQGEGFETPGATQTFMRLALDLPGLGNVVLFPGIEMERTGMLFALSGVFLSLVIVNGLFKFYINTYKGRLGERLLRRMRFTLVDHILRFPPAAFKRLKPAEVASMVKDEVEPLGGFTGEAFVSPFLLGGQAATALLFIFLQSVPLGMVTAALVGVQAFIIPRMRRRLLVLGRQRQLTARELAGRVSEIVEGIHTIRTYDTTNYERADIAARLGRIFKIRFDIYQWKFLVKFINNFLASVTPFLFYTIGGWLALQGQLDIGQLVAVIAAYKDLPGPLKELIDWDQNRQDVQVKYQTVVSQFAIDGLIEPHLQDLTRNDSAPRMEHPLGAVNLGVVDDSGAVSLSHVTLSVNEGEALAIVGQSGAGGDVLAEALARLVWPTSGKVVAGETDLQTLPEAVTGRAITYAGPDTFFFFGTVRDNLLYGLKHAPVFDVDYRGAAQGQRTWERNEARMSGNPDHDINSDWIDYASVGAKGPDDLMARVFAALDAVSLTRDILDLALRSSIVPADHGDLADRIVAMRQLLREELTRQDLNDLIVPFEPGAYNAEATVLENILFGHALRPDLSAEEIGRNPYFRGMLAEHGLDERLRNMGIEIARNAVDLLGDLPPDHPLFQSQTLMTADDIPVFQGLLKKLDSAGGTLTEADRDKMIRLSFDYIEPRFRFGLMPASLMAEIVAFRQAFREGMPADLKAGIEPYDPQTFITSAGLLDNMLFGRVSQKYRDGSDRIYAAVAALLGPLGLYERVLSIGLDFHVGAGGKRLTSARRQKLGLARALVRRSEYYVFNRPLSSLDVRAQEAMVRNVLAHLRAEGRRPGIAWVVSSVQVTPLFDRIAVFDRGNLAEEGSYDDLAKKNGIFAELIAA